MPEKRNNLQRALCSYITDTFGYILTVKGFYEQFSSWKDTRKAEVTKLNNKIEEEQLHAVLEDTVGGLKKLHSFLDAVEKLAVTSLHVFTEENQVLHLPEGVSPEQVQVVIIAARLICPLLVEFKRDPRVFFLPKLQNVEVLAYQLKKYIQTTQRICDMFEKCSIRGIKPNMNGDTVVDLSVDYSEDHIQKMLRHINQLNEIRTNQHFRMVFLFQDVSCSGFINKFRERRPRMLQSLRELEECAVQLDRMNKGAKISSVAGSSVGAVGGVLSIVGLALIPFTAGVSLALTAGGAALGVTSGVNSLVTAATEVGVNTTQQNKADEIFKIFMDDVQSLHDCLECVIGQTVTKIEAKPLDGLLEARKIALQVRGIGKGVQAFVKQISAFKGAGRAAGKGSLAVVKTARVGFNALFLGMDIFFICKDSISLAKGSETEMSKLIRARSALWRSEINSWQKICDSLSEGLQTSEEHQTVLETPFYPEKVKNQTEMEGQHAVLETPCYFTHLWQHL